MSMEEGVEKPTYRDRVGGDRVGRNSNNFSLILMSLYFNCFSNQILKTLNRGQA